MDDAEHPLYCSIHQHVGGLQGFCCLQMEGPGCWWRSERGSLKGGVTAILYLCVCVCGCLSIFVGCYFPCISCVFIWFSYPTMQAVCSYHCVSFGGCCGERVLMVRPSLVMVFTLEFVLGPHTLTRRLLHGRATRCALCSASPGAVQQDQHPAPSSAPSFRLCTGILDPGSWDPPEPQPRSRGARSGRSLRRRRAARRAA